MKKIDIINFEWSSDKARDQESSSLILNYLVHQGYKVAKAPIHKYKKYLQIFSPKIIFVSNIAGAKINVELAEFAKKKNISLITGFGEGNFRKENLEEFIWGWNRNQEILFKKIFCWNSFAYKSLIELGENISKKARLTGSPGHDKYKVIPFKKTNKKITIGIGCWGFGYYEVNKSKESHFFLEAREKFNNILISFIESQPNIEFIIKLHPGETLGLWGNGVERCDEYQNVKILYLESIQEAIAESDIWLTFDSTTTIDAWLAGKETFRLNPDNISWEPREKFFDAQINANNLNELNEYLEHFKKHRKLPRSNEFEEIKQRYIESMIYRSDGLNHVRCGNEIIQTIQNIPSHQDHILTVEDKLDVLITDIKHFLKILFKIPSKGAENSKNWNLDNLLNWSGELYRYQKKFYKDLNLSREKLLELE